MSLDDEQDRRELGAVTKNVIFQTDGPKVVGKKPSRKDIFIANKIFRPMSEILKSMESIENIAVYINIFPHKKQGISPLSYLQYHVENYLNEIYIIENRLMSYLKVLEKSYSKSDQGIEVSRIIKPIYSIVSNAFKTYRVIRGSHVHELRFSNQELDRLSTLELLSKSNDDFGQLIKQIFDRAYRKTRKNWSDKIQKDSQAIKELLDLYFGQLTKAISQNEQLMIPKNYK